jgi:hypothetical protein
MRAFLKPTALKVIFALALFFLSSYLWRWYVISTISDTFPLGFPLQFYMAWGPCPPGEICSESNFLLLILDLALWYLAGALAISKMARVRT